MKSVCTIILPSASSEKVVEDNIVKKHVKKNNVKINISAEIDTPNLQKVFVRKRMQIWEWVLLQTLIIISIT